MSSARKLDPMLKKIINWDDVDIGELKECLLSVDASQRLSRLVSARTSNGNSTHFAASDGNTELIRCILELLTPEQRYALLCKPNMYNATAVHSAAGTGHTNVLRVIRELVPRDWFNLLTSKHGTGTALHYAAIKGHMGTVEYIMSTLTSQQKNDLAQMTDKAGNTALHYAANQGHTETVRKLMFFIKPTQLVEIVNTQNNEGLTGAERAEMAGHQNTADCLHQYRSWAEEHFEGRRDEANIADRVQDLERNAAQYVDMHSQQQESIRKIQLLEGQIQELKEEKKQISEMFVQKSAELGTKLEESNNHLALHCQESGQKMQLLEEQNQELTMKNMDLKQMIKDNFVVAENGASSILTACSVIQQDFDKRLSGVESNLCRETCGYVAPETLRAVAGALEDNQQFQQIKVENIRQRLNGVEETCDYVLPTGTQTTD